MPLLKVEDLAIEWDAVLLHLDPKAAMALATASVRTMINVGAAVVKCKHMDIATRQSMVEALARALRRGLAAGHELHIAAAIWACIRCADVHVHVRRVAARHVNYVLNVKEYPSWSHGCSRQGGYKAACESASFGARTAMIVYAGDAQAVAVHVAHERDALVREYMERWYDKEV